MDDEDEVAEYRARGGEIRTLAIGLDRAEARVRGRFLQDEIDVDELDAELGRLLAKRAGI